uniref:Isopenicillin N synthase-like Fe(2+) 2OG dioxygenase domain-containing protein n=1 Tax=Physcomitrium patens TaxID=3218 RepID=A0A7I4CBD6_PHYPA
MLVLDYNLLVSISRSSQPKLEQSSSDGASLELDEEPEFSLAKACVEAMGPAGEGFVAVRGMENYARLREQEHGLGTDVPLKDPGRPVSSFAAQLRFESLLELDNIGSISKDIYDNQKAQRCAHGDSFSELGNLFKQLGMCMVRVGLLIARLFDAYQSHAGLCESSLEQAILESGTAKGRLIHYHSLLEKDILRSLQNSKTQKQNKNASKARISEVWNAAADSGVSTLWQQWHCDYGIFTVLTSPLFLKPTRDVPSEPDVATKRWTEPAVNGDHWKVDHKLSEGDSNQLQSCDNRSIQEEKPRSSRSQQLSSSSQDLNFSMQECAPPDGYSSLRVMDAHSRTTSVSIPSDYLIVQVGDAAQLLSGGELVARPHCVMRPTSDRDVSRQTMAVFLQPAWDRSLSIPPGTAQERALEAGGVATNLETHIPLLASRWKDGCTFAEFSKETTRQYYGADGRQSRK